MTIVHTVQNPTKHSQMGATRSNDLCSHVAPCQLVVKAPGQISCWEQGVEVQGSIWSLCRFLSLELPELGLLRRTM